VGAKWELFRRRLSASLALFDTRNENVIYTIDAVAVPPIFNQDDAQHLRGATIGLVGQLTSRWSAMANVAWLAGTQRSQNVLTDGRQLTLMPEWSGSVWTTWAAAGFSIGGGLRYQDRTFVNTANSIVVPGYTLIDAVASYAVNTHLTLRVNAYNLADTEYIRSINNNGGRYNPGVKQVFDAQGRSVPATTRLWPGLLAAAVLFNLLELVIRKWRSILPEKWQSAISGSQI